MDAWHPNGASDITSTIRRSIKHNKCPPFPRVTSPNCCCPQNPPTSIGFHSGIQHLIRRFIHLSSHLSASIIMPATKKATGAVGPKKTTAAAPHASYKGVYPLFAPAQNAITNRRALSGRVLRRIANAIL